MKFDTPFLLQCPFCHGLITRKTLLSGNTFHATFWSDGKRDAPMFPIFPLIGACPYCDEVLWIEDAQERGKDDEKKGKESKTLSYNEYWNALQKGMGNTPEREKQLRLSLWRAGNDAFRGYYVEQIGCVTLYLLITWFVLFQTHVSILSGILLLYFGVLALQEVPKAVRWLLLRRQVGQEYRDMNSRLYHNLSRLYTLFEEEDVYECLLTAEMSRELGWFSRVEVLLSRPIPSQYLPLKEAILKQSRSQKRKVCKITHT
jgi:hypothetical protein